MGPVIAIAHETTRLSYVYLVDPAGANQPGSRWQFEENVVLEHPREGEIVLDVLRGQRVGGPELLKHL